MKALILAAGYGTRLYPLTNNLPKALLKVGKVTIVDHLLARMINLTELNKVYIVTNNKYYKNFKNWADETNNLQIYEHLQVEVINDGTSNNETRLGAIADIQFVIEQKIIAEDLLITVGDNIFTFDFLDLCREFKARDRDLIVVHQVDEIEILRNAGVVQFDSEKRVIGFEEKPSKPKSNYACPALYLLRGSTLPLIKRYLEQRQNPDAPGNFIAWLYKVIPLYVFVMTADYYDIGNVDSYQKAVNAFDNKMNRNL
jgi:glucose-1-phosphate thymidylyltransferase